MESCKVEFIENNQKIIINCTLDDNGDFEYHPSFEPKIDGKTVLGLSGKLCEIFIKALYQIDKNENSNRSKD